jgi:hypothetical protein
MPTFDKRSEARRRKAWVKRSKHIDVKYHYVRDIVAQDKLKVYKISTDDNLVDMMTKPISVAKFELCSSLVGITV